MNNRRASQIQNYSSVTTYAYSLPPKVSLSQKSSFKTILFNKIHDNTPLENTNHFKDAKRQKKQR